MSGQNRYELWNRTKDVFERALREPEHARSALIERECAGDLELLKEVHSLLAAHKQSVDFLETPLFGGMPGAIGPYRVVAPVAEGGMGMVYEAHGPAGERVALKLIRGGVDTPELMRRFEQERASLARLDHTNIVRLAGSGVSPEGRPYFAMEFVDGVPITQFAATARDYKNSLRLFLELCDAVAYAHESGVLHRDLKPSNVLVNAAGMVKLLDFGLARAVDEASRAQPRTVTGLRILTPAYASPERLRGEAMAAPSDVYSLGVILFEMLSGQRPADLPDGSFDHMAATLEGRVPAALPGYIPRSLELIARQAIRPDAAHRYQTVRALADDIRRFLAGRAVQARPEGLDIRARRWFAARPAAKRAAAGFMLAALLVSANPWARSRIRGMLFPPKVRTVDILGLQNAGHTSESAAVGGNLTEALRGVLIESKVFRPRRADRTSAMMARLDLVPAEDLSRGTVERIRRHSAVDTVLTGSYVAENSSPASPLSVTVRLIDASEGQTIARVAQSGSVSELEAIASRLALGLVQAVAGSEASAPEADATANRESARLYVEGLARHHAADQVGARNALERAVGIDPQNARARAALADVLEGLGYRKQAVEQAERAVAAGGNLPAEDRLELQAALHQWKQEWKEAIALRRQVAAGANDLDSAVDLLETLVDARDVTGAAAAVADAEKRWPADPRGSWALAHCELHRERGEWQNLISSSRALDSRAQSLSAPALRVKAVEFEARALRELGRTAEAIEKFEQARTQCAQIGNRECAQRNLIDTAVTHMQSGSTTRAIELMQSALSQGQGHISPYLEKTIHMSLGSAYQRGHDPAAARDSFSRALALSWEADDRHGVARAALNLGFTFRDLGQVAEARRRYREAWDYRHNSGTAPEQARAAVALSEIELLAGNPAVSIDWTRQAEALAGKHERTVMDALYIRTLAEVFSGNAAALDSNFDRMTAFARKSKRLGSLGAYEQSWGESLLALGNPAGAEKHLDAALAVWNQQHRPSDVAQTQAWRARALARQGKLAGAAAAFAQARQLSAGTRFVQTRLAVELAEAELLAGKGMRGAAIRRFDSVARQYRELGLNLAAFDVEVNAARCGRDKVRLARIATEARAAGLGLFTATAERHR